MNLDPLRLIKVICAGAVFAAVIVAAFSSPASFSQDARAAEQAQKLPSQWHGLPNYSQNPAAAGKMMRELARKCDGDINKLSGDERQWAYTVASTYAPMALEMSAREIRRQDASRAGHRKPHRRARLGSRNPARKV